MVQSWRSSGGMLLRLTASAGSSVLMLFRLGTAMLHSLLRHLVGLLLLLLGRTQSLEDNLFRPPLVRYQKARSLDLSLRLLVLRG